MNGSLPAFGEMTKLMNSRNMKNHFLQVLESASMISDKCYVKCTDNLKEERDPEKWSLKGWWNEESRDCPPGEEPVTCQPECLTLQ